MTLPAESKREEWLVSFVKASRTLKDLCPILQELLKIWTEHEISKTEIPSREG